MKLVTSLCFVSTSKDTETKWTVFQIHADTQIYFQPPKPCIFLFSSQKLSVFTWNNPLVQIFKVQSLLISHLWPVLTPVSSGWAIQITVESIPRHPNLVPGQTPTPQSWTPACMFVLVWRWLRVLEGHSNQNLQQMEKWFMCQYDELTKAAEQDCCLSLDFKTLKFELTNW